MLQVWDKGMDGRIDDPNAGWKGRGLWSTSGDRTPWLSPGEPSTAFGCGSAVCPAGSAFAIPRVIV